MNLWLFASLLDPRSLVSIFVRVGLAACSDRDAAVTLKVQTNLNLDLPLQHRSRQVHIVDRGQNNRH